MGAVVTVAAGILVVQDGESAQFEPDKPRREVAKQSKALLEAPVGMVRRVEQHG